MIKETLKRQKKEAEALLAGPYIERDQAKEAKKFIDSDLIKVVTGPRRAGKSLFSLHLLKDRAPGYVNFDDETLIRLKNYDDIIGGLHAVYGDKKYLLFDEIQNLPDWELFVNRLQRQGYNITLTGSNAKLLSGELATSLTGRHIPIEIFPFSFSEFLSARGFRGGNGAPDKTEARILDLMGEFLINGGFPEIVVKGMAPKGYLDTLLDSLILKDVVKRYKVRLAGKIYDLHTYLLNNFASEASFRRLAAKLGFNSVTTLEKYFFYLEEAYLIRVLRRYSGKAAERLGSPIKIYLVDNGYIAAGAIQLSPDSGRLMENMVFTELLKKGYKPDLDLFYYRTRNNREVDFLIRRGTKAEELIQAAYHTGGPDTREREIKALVEAGEELKCGKLTVLTWNREEKHSARGVEINFVPVWKWLISAGGL